MSELLGRIFDKVSWWFIAGFFIFVTAAYFLVPPALIVYSMVNEWNAKYEGVVSGIITDKQIDRTTVYPDRRPDIDGNYNYSGSPYEVVNWYLNIDFGSGSRQYLVTENCYNSVANGQRISGNEWQGRFNSWIEVVCP